MIIIIIKSESESDVYFYYRHLFIQSFIFYITLCLVTQNIGIPLVLY